MRKVLCTLWFLLAWNALNVCGEVCHGSQYTWWIRSIFVIAQPLWISITAKHEPFPPFISLTPHSRHKEIPVSLSVPKSPLGRKCTCVKSNWYAEFLNMHCFRVSRLKLHSFERCIQMCSVCGLFFSLSLSRLENWIAELVLNGKKALWIWELWRKLNQEYGYWDKRFNNTFESPREKMLKIDITRIYSMDKFSI